MTSLEEQTSTQKNENHVEKSKFSYPKKNTFQTVIIYLIDILKNLIQQKLRGRILTCTFISPSLSSSVLTVLT